jgi:ArsR family transcriptional regulator, arsenate/arsenite/antimonite-responsive transcriptional repressor
MTQPAISKHLSVLENAGLVWREKRGINVHYGLKQDSLAGTPVHFLAEVCPRSRPFRRDSAALARRRKKAQSVLED